MKPGLLIAFIVTLPLFSAETASYQPPEPPLGTGPYKAVMEFDSSLPTHTEYRLKEPATLRAASANTEIGLSCKLHSALLTT